MTEQRRCCLNSTGSAALGFAARGLRMDLSSQGDSNCSQAQSAGPVPEQVLSLSASEWFKPVRVHTEEKTMKKILIIATTTLTLAACNHTRQDATLTGAAVGAGAGAIVGGIATGTAKGAAVGAAVGGAAGAIIGHVSGRPGYCYARDRYGRQIVVKCPARY